jgi:hypothetical protein
MKASDYSELMEVEAFQGAGSNNLVLCQEWPDIEGERYVRIVIPMRDALELACKIITVANNVEDRNKR